MDGKFAIKRLFKELERGGRRTSKVIWNAWVPR